MPGRGGASSGEPGSAPDWNADVYHRISEPQFKWGLEVLAGLQLGGDETVLDAGCGSGRLTAKLLERLPNGHVIALDQSPAMIEKAREALRPFGDRVSFQLGDLSSLELERVADVVFSNAAFHWVKDHDALFRGLYRALKPGGRLHAQCGGHGNLDEHLKVALAAAKLPPLEYPTYFADPDSTLRRMTNAGFTEAKAWLKPAPTPFSDADSFRTFIAHVTLRTVLGQLGARADAVLDEVVKQSSPAYSLDYVRLELRGSRS